MKKYESVEYTTFNEKGNCEVKLFHYQSLFRFLFNKSTKIEVYEKVNPFYGHWFNSETGKKVGINNKELIKMGYELS